MMLRQRGKYRYGDSQADIQDEVLRYSKANTYLAHHFAEAACKCGGKIFTLLLDDDAGVAVRRCVRCAAEHPVGDSGEYLQDAELKECACPCGREEFEITVGVSIYEGSDDVLWLYLGCRCPRCGLTAVYGDWKNEFNGYQALLARV
jgi:DNA-directed RNA polymerase subunit RPC12/RpoP